MRKKYLLFFALSGGMAVLLGAFSSHYLKSLVQKGEISFASLDAFKTAVLYQFIQSFQIGISSVLFKDEENQTLRWALRCSSWGMILFSGSIYILVTGEILKTDYLKALGPVTPLGGILMIVSWFLLFLHIRNQKGNRI